MKSENLALIVFLLLALAFCKPVIEAVPASPDAASGPTMGQQARDAVHQAAAYFGRQPVEPDNYDQAAMKVCIDRAYSLVADLWPGFNEIERSAMAIRIIAQCESEQQENY